jgi:hypothetical protein
VVAFAGYDVVLRAKNSWDISATNHDGRLKAKRNLMMVASGDCGGVLIQSKAIAPFCDATDKTGEDAVIGGIVIKAENSLITQYARDISIKLNDSLFDEHTLVLDTGWNGRLKFKSKFYERFLNKEGAALDFWVTPAGPQDDGMVISGTEYWHDGTLFNAPVVITDKLLVNGCVVARDNLISLEGHVITDQANNYHGLVGKLKTGDALTTQLDDYLFRAEVDLPTIGDDELHTLQLTQNQYNCADAEFSFRSVEQYKTSDYVLFESRWQQLARIGGVDVSVWTEEAVNDTYPYPGAENLLGATYRTLDPNLYDITTGVAETRGIDYEEPEFNAPVAEILNDMYTVII